MRERLEHKYDCLNKIESIIQNCKNNDAINLIVDLRELIFYQMHEIRDQRIKIISMEHQEAWKHYDKPIDSYDPSTRKYIDKPPKSGNMSC